MNERTEKSRGQWEGAEKDNPINLAGIEKGEFQKGKHFNLIHFDDKIDFLESVRWQNPNERT